MATKYQHGKDIQQDENQAFTWYKAASAAQLNVGQGRLMVLVIKETKLLARKYFEKQPVTVTTVPAFNLAMMEEQKKNYVGAYQWYELSTRDGMLDNKVISCLKVKNRFSSKLKPRPVRMARDRADKWIQAQ